MLSCEDQVRGQPVPPSVQAMRDGMPPRLVGAVASRAGSAVRLFFSALGSFIFRRNAACTPVQPVS